MLAVDEVGTESVMREKGMMLGEEMSCAGIWGVKLRYERPSYAELWPRDSSILEEDM